MAMATCKFIPKACKVIYMVCKWKTNRTIHVVVMVVIQEIDQLSVNCMVQEIAYPSPCTIDRSWCTGKPNTDYSKAVHLSLNKKTTHNLHTMKKTDDNRPVVLIHFALLLSMLWITATGIIFAYSFGFMLIS